MHSLRVLFLVLLLSLAFCISACAAERVTCYTMWDDYYFYAGFEVQDADVTGANTKHMSNPWEDDCVEVFLETDSQRAPSRTSGTFQLSVSASGGSSFVIGEDGQPKPKKIFSFKFARKVQGTLNRSSDKDIGYSVEFAIPWKETGGPPTPGRVMGFNVICRMKGENTGFVSLSPDVVSEEEIQVPARWARVKFVDTPTVVAMEDGAIVCRKVANKAPLVDGIIGRGEWIRDMSFQIIKPEPKEQPLQQFLIEKLALTTYYWCKEGTLAVKLTERSGMKDRPLEGAGPWYSYDRVQWHKDQLSGMAYAGIDVVLPVLPGWVGTDRNYAREYISTGLSCMAQAMKELKAEGKGFPLVGIRIDSPYGGVPPQGDKSASELYEVIRDSFLQVPDEFRAVVQMPGEKGGCPAYIVMLSPPWWLRGDFIEYCNKRFEEDFGGHRLVWIINKPRLESELPDMDACIDFDSAKGLRTDSTGWIRMAAISPGYDGSIYDAGSPVVCPREDGKPYQQDWDALIAGTPDWVWVDSWNNLCTRTEVCPTAEHGERYVSLTKMNLIRFNGRRPYDAKFLRHDMPSVMLPGALYRVTLAIKNCGKLPWYSGDGIFVTGRWYKDGVLYSESGARLPLQEKVLPGQILRKTIGLRTVDQDSKPLPEGGYELRWDILRGRDQWFSNGGDTPLCVPVKVGTPSDSPAAKAPVFSLTVVDSTLPAIVKSGSTYNVKLRIRNDGPETVEAQSAADEPSFGVSYEWRKEMPSSGEVSLETVSAQHVRSEIVPLTAAWHPGRIAEFDVPVKVVADGKPLPPSTPGDPQAYVLVWKAVPVRLDGQDPPLVLLSAREPVRVVDAAACPRFTANDIPKQMSPGKAYKINLTLENAGTETWTKAEYKVGCRWYNADGTKLPEGGGASPLPADVQPGEQVTVKAAATAPAKSGEYYLVFDLVRGYTGTSASPGIRGADMLVVPVKVGK